MHFKRHFAFQNAYDYIFSRKPEKNLDFTSKFRYGRVTLNTDEALEGFLGIQGY